MLWKQILTDSLTDSYLYLIYVFLLSVVRVNTRIRPKIKLSNAWFDSLKQMKSVLMIAYYISKSSANVSDKVNYLKLKNYYKAAITY